MTATYTADDWRDEAQQQRTRAEAAEDERDRALTELLDVRNVLTKVLNELCVLRDEIKERL